MFPAQVAGISNFGMSISWGLLLRSWDLIQRYTCAGFSHAGSCCCNDSGSLLIVAVTPQARRGSGAGKPRSEPNPGWVSWDQPSDSLCEKLAPRIQNLSLRFQSKSPCMEAPPPPRPRSKRSRRSWRFWGGPTKGTSRPSSSSAPTKPSGPRAPGANTNRY